MTPTLFSFFPSIKAPELELVHTVFQFNEGLSAHMAAVIGIDGLKQRSARPATCFCPTVVERAHPRTGQLQLGPPWVHFSKALRPPAVSVCRISLA